MEPDVSNELMARTWRKVVDKAAFLCNSAENLVISDSRGRTEIFRGRTNGTQLLPNFGRSL